MRRPAQHHPTPAIASAWVHPYPAGLFNPVFYSTGAVEPPVAPAAPVVPTPAQLAARAQQPSTVAPVAPVDPAEAKVSFTQRRLDAMMADEKEQGRRAALRAFAESAGIDPDQVDLDQVGKLVKDANAVSRQRMSDLERREADAKATADTAARQVADAQAETAAAKKLARDAQQTIILTRLGVKGDDLADVGALLRNDLAAVDDPTPAQLQEYAEKLKARRPADFGAPVHASVLPPAPGGSPAGGTTSRAATGTKDAVNTAARERAIAMGLRAAD